MGEVGPMQARFLPGLSRSPCIDQRRLQLIWNSCWHIVASSPTSFHDSTESIVALPKDPVSFQYAINIKCRSLGLVCREQQRVCPTPLQLSYRHPSWRSMYRSGFQYLEYQKQKHPHPWMFPQWVHGFSHKGCKPEDPSPDLFRPWLFPLRKRSLLHHVQDHIMQSGRSQEFVKRQRLIKFPFTRNICN